VVADGMIGGKHRSNMELIAQGTANIASVLFGGIPATGAIARTAANVHNGGRTPVAGMVHALTLLVIMYFCAGLAKMIPLACLAGILMVVAYRMGEWHSFQLVLRSSKSEAGVLLITFILTVAIDLTAAIMIGMVLASFMFVYRVAESQNIKVITGELSDDEEGADPMAITKRTVPEGVEVYEITGSFFFGIASTFIETMRNIERRPKIRILRMRNVVSVDMTAVNALRQIRKFCKAEKIELFLSGVHSQPLIMLERSGFLDEIGEDNIFGNIDEALNAARARLSA
jgi:SulP family sulfate permease